MRIIIYYWMDLRGIQEYFATDNNNIAQVEDENIVSISGNIFLYAPKKSQLMLSLLFM